MFNDMGAEGVNDRIFNETRSQTITNGMFRDTTIHMIFFAMLMILSGMFGPELKRAIVTTLGCIAGGWRYALPSLLSIVE